VSPLDRGYEDQQYGMYDADAYDIAIELIGIGV